MFLSPRKAAAALMTVVLPGLSACTDTPQSVTEPAAQGTPGPQVESPQPEGSAAGHPRGDGRGRGSSSSYYALPGLDHGLLQSPVNILTSDTVGSVVHRVQLATAPHGLASVENTGHTVRLAFPRGGVLRFDDKDYDVLQVHFHTPSEHQVDGVTYPMEMHIVSQRQRADRPGAVPDYVVIAGLFKMGQPNSFIAEFIEQVPDRSGDSRALAPDSVDLHDCYDLDDPHHYYHYRGSLTTPPYTESVDWLVLKDVIEASPEQIARINLIEGDNARHVQALYRRRVELN